MYEALADRLFAAAYRYLRDWGAAEDAVQQAFLELYRSDFQPAETRSLEAWMFTSIRFSCFNEQRRRRRHPEIPSDELPSVAVAGEFDEGLDVKLEEALAQLTPQQRLVVHLKHVEGFDGAEIAAILGSNRVAVYAMASRAEARLRKLLAPVESRFLPGSLQAKGEGSDAQ